MKLPEGISEAEWLEAAGRVAHLLSATLKIPGREPDDVKQDAHVFALEAMAKYKPSSGTLEGYLYRVVRNRLLNHLRDKVRRQDPPCRKCAAGRPCGPEGQECARHRRWEFVQGRKACLAASGQGQALEDTARVEGHAESDVEIAEVLQLLDERLSVNDRRSLLMMRAGGQGVCKQEQRRVKQAVLDILAEVGLTPESRGLAGVQGGVAA